VNYLLVNHVLDTGPVANFVVKKLNVYDSRSCFSVVANYFSLYLDANNHLYSQFLFRYGKYFASLLTVIVMFHVNIFCSSQLLMELFWARYFFLLVCESVVMA